MFGGLEIKGGIVDKRPDQKQQQQQQQQQLQNQQPQSGFSFLTTNAGPAATPTLPITPTTSAFNFMTQTTTTLTQAPNVSGFNFLSQPEPQSPLSQLKSNMPSSATTTPTMSLPIMGESNSGFSFLQTTSTPTVDRPPSFMVNDSHSGTNAAGAGVTFGGAQRKPMKRRTRSAKVGTETGAAVDSMQITEGNLEETIRRTEDFMQHKLQEKSKLGSVASDHVVSKVGLKDVPKFTYTPDMDDELMEAQRAAEEAQAMLARDANKDGINKSGFSWFGAGRRNNNAKGDDDVRGPTHTRDSSQLIPTPDSSLHAHRPETAAERILREQEEIKRAMAERHKVKLNQQESKDYDIYQMPTWEKPSDPIPSWGKPAMEYLSEVPPPPSMPSWGTKGPTPPPPSPLQLMHIILEQFAGDVNRAMEHVSDLRQQRNMLLEERFVALAKERLATQQILQTEAQQMEAAENEEFEVADHLQIVLEGHHREKAECSSILSNISQALAQLDEQTPKVVYGVTRCFENVARDLEELDAKQKSQDEDSSELLEKFAITARQLAGEGERLKGEEKHLERDEEMVNMERKELDDAIAEQTADIEELREEKRKQLLLVEKEMDDLREQLRLKELQANEIKMKMEAHNDEISKVMVQFNRQISRVQKKGLSVRENRREWINEYNAYQKLKDAHEAEVKAHSETLLQRNTVADEIKTNIKMSSTFQEIISREVTFEHIREEDEDMDIILAQIQADVVKCEAAVAEAGQIAKTTETRLVSLDGESRRIQEKLPKLEEEKLKAAAKRDFKAAGKASKEIKELSTRLQELEETLIREAKKKYQEAKKSLEKAQQDLEREQTSAKEKQRESSQVTMEKIAKRIKALMGMKANVCGDTSNESVNKVGGMVLQGQIDALLQEGQFLGHKFGGWDEIMSEFDNSDQTSHVEEQVTPKEFVDVSDRSCSEVSPETLETARALMKRHAQVEKEIDTAAEEEDFDKAAELDEVLRSIKDELHKLNLTDAEFDLLAVNDNTHAEVEKEDEIVHQPRSRDDVIPENVERAKALIQQQYQLEKEINSAVQEQDNAKADEINDAIRSIKEELFNLNLTDAESDLLASVHVEVEEVANNEVVVDETSPAPAVITTESLAEDDAEKTSDPEPSNGEESAAVSEQDTDDAQGVSVKESIHSVENEIEQNSEEP